MKSKWLVGHFWNRLPFLRFLHKFDLLKNSVWSSTIRQLSLRPLLEGFELAWNRTPDHRWRNVKGALTWWCCLDGDLDGVSCDDWECDQAEKREEMIMPITNFMHTGNKKMQSFILVQRGFLNFFSAQHVLLYVFSKIFISLNFAHGRNISSKGISFTGYKMNNLVNFW